MVTYDDIADAHERVRPRITRTPVLSSAAIDERVRLARREHRRAARRALDALVRGGDVLERNHHLEL